MFSVCYNLNSARGLPACAHYMFASMAKTSLSTACYLHGFFVAGSRGENRNRIGCGGVKVIDMGPGGVVRQVAKRMSSKAIKSDGAAAIFLAERMQSVLNAYSEYFIELKQAW